MNLATKNGRESSTSCIFTVERDWDKLGCGIGYTMLRYVEVDLSLILSLEN